MVRPMDLAAKARRRTLWWLSGSFMGGIVMAAPDATDRLFSLSRTHGPSLVDSIGIVIAVAAWLPLAAILPRLWTTSHRSVAFLTASLAVLGAAGLPVTIALDLGWTWVLPVAALAIAQVLLVIDGWRR